MPSPLSLIPDAPIPMPDEPLRVALIGAGNRSRTIYAPLVESLAPWLRLVGVCDPVREHADALAAELGVPAWHDIRRLVADRPLEAAIIVTPVASHHSISIFLSHNGIHNHCETTWASMYCQAEQMLHSSREHGVVATVAENFMRMPLDRFAQTVRDHGYIGEIRRIMSYAAHTGYHNNSRWVHYMQAQPAWVQSIEHAIPHAPYYSMPQRRHESETYRARFIGFPGERLVIDHAANIKGFLGRLPRPGHEEFQGSRGTLIQTIQRANWGHEIGRDFQVELRRLSDAKFADGQGENRNGGGFADQITPVEYTCDAKGNWASCHADTPAGRIEYVNPFRPLRPANHGASSWYSVPIMDHVIDFVLAVKGLRELEFRPEDALASEMIEIGARESALQESRRVVLPLAGDLEADAITRGEQRAQFGVDPLDVDAMLSVSFPRP
jgi:hypothetical protein